MGREPRGSWGAARALPALSLLGQSTEGRHRVRVSSCAPLASFLLLVPQGPGQGRTGLPCSSTRPVSRAGEAAQVAGGDKPWSQTASAALGTASTSLSRPPVCESGVATPLHEVARGRSESLSVRSLGRFLAQT